MHCVLLADCVLHIRPFFYCQARAALDFVLGPDVGIADKDMLYINIAQAHERARKAKWAFDQS